tara:strand:+ start:1248 stop:3167 length:1920 start_codon:yes stop_codon:yes gene_type:complete
MIDDQTLAPVIRGLREKRDASREDYKGTKVPYGMDDDSRRAWEEAIDMREGPTEAAAATRTRANIRDTGKGMGESAYGFVEPYVKAHQWVGRAAKDPEVALEAGEFIRSIGSGDRESRKQLAEGASMGMVEPAATLGDIALTGYALDEGAYGLAAISGASVLLPFVTAGWLKNAMRAGEIPPEAAKKVAELEGRVNAGGVTDEMQIRRELASIEDAHVSEYNQSLAESDSDFDFGPQTDPTLYRSVLEDTLLNPKVQGKTPVDQLIPSLKSLGVKQAEMNAVGLPEFVAAQKAGGARHILKDDLVRHVDENRVVMGEQVFDSRMPEGSLGGPHDDFTGSHIMPGGRDAKDILVTGQRFDDPAKQFSDPRHYGVLDEVVRLRTTDRYDYRGRKLRFVDELQSDHGQALRARGATWAENKLKRDRAQAAADSTKREYGAAYLARNGMSRADRAVSKRDFSKLYDAWIKAKKNLNTTWRGPVLTPLAWDKTDEWTDLGIRRALRDAADDPTIDGIAFTSGSMASKHSYMPIDSAENFYGKIVPSRLKKIVGKDSVGKTVIRTTDDFMPQTTKLDPKYWDSSRESMLMGDGLEFTVVDLTPAVREKAREAIKNFGVGIGAGIGAAGSAKLLRQRRDDAQESDL